MLTDRTSQQERWSGISELVDKWLMERQELIVKLCDLSLNPGSSQENTVERLQGFCQILVDYVSVGHFEVYEQLLTEVAEYDESNIELGNQVIPKIQASTEIALNFNDRFDDINKVDDGIEGVILELENLGKTLEERFELEDTLIEALHKAHSGSAA